MNAVQSSVTFVKNHNKGHLKPQCLQGFYHYPQKNFAKNFVSFEIMLYLQLIAKLLSGKANNVEKEKIYDRIYH